MDVHQFFLIIKADRVVALQVVHLHFRLSQEVLFNSFVLLHGCKPQVWLQLDYFSERNQ